jgi:hypothetical protein
VRLRKPPGDYRSRLKQQAAGFAGSRGVIFLFADRDLTRFVIPDGGVSQDIPLV